MSHLGEKVSALVDGQLSVEATERAYAHLAHCRDCRDLVETERLLKSRLTCLPDPAPGADLVGRLLALGGPSGPLPPRPGHVPGSPRPVPVALPALTAARSAGAPAASAARPAPLGGFGRGRAARIGVPRPSTYSAASSRPAGRSTAPRRARLAGAVLGALGVVSAGVTGLVLAAPDSPRPVQTPPDTLVAQFPAQTRSPVSIDVSLELRQNRSFSVRTPQATGGGR